MLKNYKRRRSFLIKPRLQIRIIGMIMFVLAAFIFTLCVFIYLIAQDNIPILENASVRQQFEEGLHLFFYQLSIVAVIALISAFGIGVVVTHRVAGPLFVIERFLDRLLDGNFEIDDLRLRKNSELHSIAKKLNEIKNLLKKNSSGS
ncbi:MAG: hypothetical protein KDD48_03260 [Bdellovibrionales bacterium]|nr:hypothetical protein [Bdellovibrionales bacterium]